jgi:hypothetical protein
MDITEGVDCISDTRERGRWRAVMYKVMNSGFYETPGICWLSETLLAFQEGFSSTELVIWLVV